MQFSLLLMYLKEAIASDSLVNEWQGMLHLPCRVSMWMPGLRTLNDACHHAILKTFIYS